ncbi:protein of unknown function DUF58 [Oscillochloris trichoides DG-6]|uniref:DUF58 domain-containing protein n=1 Tax=Oscillochloris trichoides DG-6 TaxID=765420 RepID=E1IF66_9CHLR|nr:DUF58 domain-containing protein [Oscillochloris trichoides]EFO80165.1 protein of unknown function DUF58 [Oscillochloris trichoides DG-6]
MLDPSFLRKLDRLSLITRRAMRGELQGERRSPRRGASVEFADFRPYASGDDIRQIDWNLYARAERFYLKLFVAEEELNLHLLIDTSASMDWGEPNKLRYAQQLAAALGYIALSNLDRVSVHAIGTGSAQSLSGVRGKRGAIPLFNFMQNLQAGGTTQLAQRCRQYVMNVRNPGPLLLCSDLLDPNWREALTALTTRPFEVTVMHILAPQELNPELEGEFKLNDAEGGPSIEVSADSSLLERYRANLAAWQREVESYCNGRNMTYVAIDTALPVEELVISQLRSRRVVR